MEEILFLDAILNADDDIYKHKSLLMHWMCPKYIVRFNLQTSQQSYKQEMTS